MSLLDAAVPLLAAAVGLAAAGHALLFKRDPRAAVGWIAVSLFLPLVGPFLYYVLGINRIRTRAQRLQDQADAPGAAQEQLSTTGSTEVEAKFSELDAVAGAVSGEPLCGGNRVEVLNNGEEAYPAMLEAIDRARRRVLLASYIFDTDGAGMRFVDALAATTRRGVEVRVLVDGVGELYAWPRVSRVLRRRGVAVARFLPPRLLPPTFHLNLRNHRKILAVDGEVGFTGGMNLGDRHLAARSRASRRVVDAHFRLRGPIVAAMEGPFLEDWRFVTGERLEPSPPAAASDGDAACRVIVEGPNEDLDKLTMVLLGAVSAARSRVRVMTPYFLPPRSLVAALQGAALRGVAVEVILPQKNNLPYVHWATRNMLWELLERGVRVFYQPGPFVHTKLFVVDDHYVQIGSANLDARSLRLNFELVVEVYSTAFGERVAGYFERVRRRSREETLAQVDGRSLPARVRDGLAWLLSPYL